MTVGLKMLEICLFVSGGSRVEAVAEAVVAEAACTKSMEITASHLNNFMLLCQTLIILVLFKNLNILVSNSHKCLNSYTCLGYNFCNNWLNAFIFCIYVCVELTMICIIL